jgi:hypothetical protein
MYYVIFSWATGGIKFWAKCHFIYYILRSYCWRHEFFEILPRIGNNMCPPFFSSSNPKGHVSFCHHFASVVRPSTITKTYSPLKPLGHLRPNFGGMVRKWSPSKIVSGSPDLQPTWSLLLKIKKGDEILKIFISETTGPIGTKLCLDSPWMTPFQKCVWQSRHPTNMATVAKNRKGGMKFYLFSSENTGPIGFKLC